MRRQKDMMMQKKCFCLHMNVLRLEERSYTVLQNWQSMQAITGAGKEDSKREAFVLMEYGRADVYDTNDAETVEAAEWYMDEQNNEDHEKQSAYDDIADGCTERILDCLAICKEETH